MKNSRRMVIMITLGVVVGVCLSWLVVNIPHTPKHQATQSQSEPLGYFSPDGKFHAQ